MKNIIQITKENLSFRVFKLKNKDDINLNTFNVCEFNPLILSTIFSQKTNFVEGNTTNINDAFNIINNKPTIGLYKITEQLEIKNIQQIYLNLITKKNYRLNLLKLHKDMYKNIIDINFIPGTLKSSNNFTWLTKDNIRYVHRYLDHNQTLDCLKQNSLYLNDIQKLESKEDKLLNLFIWHCNFESIHPFPDGNGRIGRIYLDKELIKLDLTPLILTNEIKKDYFELISLVEEHKINSSFIEKLNTLFLNSNKILLSEIKWFKDKNNFELKNINDAIFED